MCFQGSSKRIEWKSQLSKPGWKVVPQSRTGSRETFVAKFVVCSWHEQLPDVVGMRPQRATTSVRQWEIKESSSANETCMTRNRKLSVKCRKWDYVNCCVVWLTVRKKGLLMLMITTTMIKACCSTCLGVENGFSSSASWKIGSRLDIAVIWSTICCSSARTVVTSTVLDTAQRSRAILSSQLIIVRYFD